jgi:RNA polymerase sigma-70 factor (ECF subfamily)
LTDDPATADTRVATLVASHRQFLAFVRNRVTNTDDAEEILQAAFVKSVEKVAAVRDDESVVAWFFRVLRNAIADHHRRRATETQRVHSAGDGLPDLAAIEPEAERTLCHCLAGLAALLKPEYSDLIQRIDLGGGDPAAVAQDLGITAGNLRVRLHRARAALREELQRTCRTCATHGCLDCTCGKPGGDPSCH